jgi:hypothetical protein
MQTGASKLVNRAAEPKPAAAVQPVQVSATAGGVQCAGAMKVSSPSDAAEKEAEGTAKRIMRMADPSATSSFSSAPPSTQASSLANSVARSATPILQRELRIARH